MSQQRERRGVWLMGRQNQTTREGDQDVLPPRCASCAYMFKTSLNLYWLMLRNFMFYNDFQPFQGRWEANFVWALTLKVKIQNFNVWAAAEDCIHRRHFQITQREWISNCSSFSDGKLIVIELCTCTWIAPKILRNKQIMLDISHFITTYHW